MDRDTQSSSVVIRGLDATTFAQMEDFVNNLASRPVDRLLHDLPKLIKLSPTKFALVSYVLKGKFDSATPDEKEQLRHTVTAVLETVAEEEKRERLEKLLARLKKR